MKSALFIADSSTSITNAITDATQIMCYKLTALSGIYFQDQSVGGMTIAPRQGFPNNCIDFDLNSLRGVIRRSSASYVFVLMGANDYVMGHDLAYVKSEYKAFCMYVQNLNKIPVVITPLSMQGDLGLQLWRGSFQSMASAINCPGIDGTSLLDINNPEFWSDGAHPSQIGHGQIAININAQLSTLGITP